MSGPFMGWDGFYIFLFEAFLLHFWEREKNITGNGYEQFNYYFSI